MKFTIELNFDETQLTKEQKAQVVDNLIAAIISQADNEGVAPDDTEETTELISVTEESTGQNITKIFDLQKLRWETL